MYTLTGIPASPGIAIGPIHLYKKAETAEVLTPAVPYSLYSHGVFACESEYNSAPQ